MNIKTSLNNYLVFYEVAKAKNITKASEELFISQPAVTQTIKKLEKELGVVLFIRSKKGMKLTKIGEKIYYDVESAIKSFTRITDTINNENDLITGEINIASGSNIARKLLTTPVSEFCLDYPNIDINILEGSQKSMLKDLEDGKIDFVLTQKTSNVSFPFLEMQKTGYCFVKSKNMIQNRFIIIRDGSYTYELFKEFEKANNLSNPKVLHVSSYKIALSLVMKGIGITLVPTHILDEVDSQDLEKVYTDYKFPETTFVVYYNPNTLTKAAKIFLEYLEA